MPKSKYVTRQRRLLLSCLGQHPDELLSARQIAEALEGESVSLSAVYRNLADLEAEGRIRRVHRGSDREICFQYLDSGDCRNCLHLSCTRCGRTFHMDADGAEQLIHTVAERDGFALDKRETVLYGLCDGCQE